MDGSCGAERLFLPRETLFREENVLHFPCLIYDETGIRARAREICEAFSWNSGFSQYFSVKTLPNPSILKLLREEGMGVVCTNPIELELVKRCGFSGNEVVFAPVLPDCAAFKEALQLNCQWILDDAAFLNTLELCGRFPDRIGLRYNPGGRLAINRHTLSKPEDSRFGMPRETLLRAVSVLKSKGIEEIGLCAHFAGSRYEPEYYPSVANMLFTFAEELHRESGLHIAYCDLSGGLGVRKSAADPEIDLMHVSEEIWDLWSKQLIPAEMSDLAIHTQLGAYVTGESGILISRVCSVKESWRSYLNVDASSGLLERSYLSSFRCHPLLLQRNPSSELRLYDVAGCASDHGDRLASRKMLPLAQTGDYVVLQNTGAYAASSNLGQIPGCAEYLYTKEGALRLIRRPQTAEEYFATLSCNPDLH